MANDKIEIRIGWESSAIADVADINPRHAAEIPSSRNVSFVPMASIDESSWQFKHAESRSFGEVRNGYTHFADNDVLFAKITPCMENGKAAIATNLVNGLGCGTTEVHVIRPHSGIEPKFIYHYLHQEAFRRTARQNMTGTAGQLRVPVEFIKHTELPIPPTGEQQRIVAKLEKLLSNVNNCKERLDKIPAILKRFRQSLFAVATSGKLTESWDDVRASATAPRIVSLKEVAIDFSYGTSAKSVAEGIVPVLRMGNIQNGNLDWSDLVYTSNEEEIEKYKLMPGDVLFNRTNSPELVGKTAVYKGESPAIYAGYLIRIRCGNEILPDYLNYCLNSPNGRDYCQSVKSDGVSQSNINAKKLAMFELELPPIEEQNEIVRRVDALLKIADDIEKRYEKARSHVDRLTQSILAKAFRGELVPQDPDDEPASELLKRIKQERASKEEKARTRTKKIR